MSDPTILIVDDEPAIRDMIGITLDLAGFNSMSAETAHQAHVAIVDSRPDLVLLDWMLPGGSGIELARRLKRDELTASLPIIMLTAKTSEDNKVQGLDVGVDDYVTKPFSPRELVARIKAVLRRSNGTQQDKVIRVFDLQLDPSSHRVSIEDQAVDIDIGHESGLDRPGEKARDQRDNPDENGHPDQVLGRPGKPHGRHRFVLHFIVTRRHAHPFRIAPAHIGAGTFRPFLGV